jgi:chaperonin cofactor prefoldin
MEAQKQLPPEYQTRLDALQKANASLRELVNRQQQFEAQHTENAMVKAELDALKADEPVFKLHGKVLVRQDPQDAKTTVAQRIKMIEGELCGGAARRRAAAPHFNSGGRLARVAFRRLRLTVPSTPSPPLRAPRAAALSSERRLPRRRRRRRARSRRSASMPPRTRCGETAAVAAA